MVYTFKYANTQSPNHPRSKSMELFKEQLEKASNGRIKVELYFSGVLGKEAEVLDMVVTGSVQGCRGGLFERANKMYLLYTLPFQVPQDFIYLGRTVGILAGLLPWLVLRAVLPYSGNRSED